MTLLPVFQAPLLIQCHILAACLAIALGPLALYRQRRDRVHRVLGYSWVTAMAVTAVSSFWIHGWAVVGPFGPIHFLSLLVLWSLWHGVRHAIAGRAADHAATMRSLYWRGLAIAGLFTLIPGRVVNRVVFPDRPDLGWVMIVIAAAALIAVPWLSARTARPQKAAGARP